MTGGDLAMKFFEPGALIPANEGFDATSKGSIEAAWTSAGYDVGKHPALAFFTAVPFGPTMGEYFAWKKFDGGDVLELEIYSQHDAKKIGCVAIGRSRHAGPRQLRYPSRARATMRGAGGHRPGRVSAPPGPAPRGRLFPVRARGTR